MDTNANVGATSSAINDLKFSNSISKIENSNNDKETKPKNSERLIDLCYSCSIIANEMVEKLIFFFYKYLNILYY